MRVLLAGATGAMGTVLVPRLIAAGHEVVGITRRPGALDGTGATALVADLADRPGVLAGVAGERFDAVIHHATALKRPPRGYRSVRATNRLRSEGTSTLIAAARSTGAKKFVAASVVYGYGFGDHGTAALDESAPFGEIVDGRLGAVQAALASLEQQVYAFGGVSLRFGLYYAATDPIPPVSVDWDGLLPFVHIDDAADATVLALEKARPRTVFSIADDTPVSWRTLHEARARAAHHRAPALRSWMIAAAAPFAAQLVTRTQIVVSNDRAKAKLGWTPRYPGYRDALRVE